MAIQPGDVVFTRFGRPVLVTARNPLSSEVVLDHSLETVQREATFGIKNGLSPEQRESFESSRFETLSEDKKVEILKLRDRIKDLKEKNADRKVVHYLEGELQHLIVREGFIPRDYEVDERTLIKG